MERIRGYRYRAYPNKRQREFFEKTFGCCRFVYNHYLEIRKAAWNDWHDRLSYAGMCRDLTVLTREKEWLKEADSIALRQSLRHLEKAYQNFFKRRGNHPQFRKKHAVQSYRTININQNIRIDGDTIRLPKAGKVRIVNTRAFDGRIVSATVTKTASGRYYISLQIEEEYEILPNGGGIIGIDVGIKALCTDSSGAIIRNPRTLAAHEKRIQRLQKNLARKKEGSKNREKARIKLAREHEKVVDIRDDYQHKITAKLAKDNQIVCIEDLNVDGLKKNHRLAKSIVDASWGEFCRKLEYKVAEHGGITVRVPRNYPSSQICSFCGEKNPEVKNLALRNWTCPVCGAEHDRDINAARNILNKGLEMLAS